MTKKLYYLAGPMTGIDQSNFPMFDSVAGQLRELGFSIVSPAELDSPEDRASALANKRSTKSWGDFLSRDVKIVADQVQGIIFLPGWEKSRGARLEATVGLLQSNFEFRRWDEEARTSVPIARSTVAFTVHSHILRNL